MDHRELLRFILTPLLGAAIQDEEKRDEDSHRPSKKLEEIVSITLERRRLSEAT